MNHYEWEFSLNEVGGALKVYSYSYTGNNRSEVRLNSAGLSTSSWNMVAGVMNNNGTVPNNGIYSNSTVYAGTTVAWSGSPYLNGTANVLIGHREDFPGGQFYQGAVAHVAILDKDTDLTNILVAAAHEGWY